MSTSLDEYAQRARNAGETLADAAAALRRVDPGQWCFAADAPGRLGELGRMLYARWAAARHAREQEAATHGARLADLAHALRQVDGTARAVDASAADRHRREEA